MLEQPSLLLGPWIHTFEAAWPKAMVQGAAWIRTIANPATQQSLGFAAWDTVGLSGVLAWLGRKKIQVFETEDESLLLTLYRPWGLLRSWQVLDAEDRRVARLCRDIIYDGSGAMLATLSTSTDGADCVWRGDDGLVLASWQDNPGLGCYFRFSQAIVHNPFVRMAALAGVLALPPWPGDLALAARPAV